MHTSARKNSVFLALVDLESTKVRNNIMFPFMHIYRRFDILFSGFAVLRKDLVLSMVFFHA